MNLVSELAPLQIGADGVVEVKNSYAVPHNENGGQVFVDVEFHRWGGASLMTPSIPELKALSVSTIGK